MDRADMGLMDRSEGMICGRCNKPTGNNHQGHHWAMCSALIKRGVSYKDAMREHHFCCPNDCELDEKEIMLLANWVHEQPWGITGGPLHIMLDDYNLEDRWFEPGSFLYKAVEDDAEYEGSENIEADKAKCRRLLELMMFFTEERREDVLDAAYGVPKVESWTPPTHEGSDPVRRVSGPIA